jgi:cytoskeleton protein RodZ
MSETSNPDVPSGASALLNASPTTAGQWLRAARQKAGVQLAVLSVTLKVPVKELEALEADQLDPAKGPVFARALASSVCRQLRIDATPVLALLPQSSHRLPPQRFVSALSSSGRALGSRSLSSPRIHSRHALILVALMLLLTAALIWLPAPSQWAWLDGVNFLGHSSEPVVPAASEPAFMAPPGSVMEPAAQASDQAVFQSSSVMVPATPVPSASAPLAPAALGGKP